MRDRSTMCLFLCPDGIHYVGNASRRTWSCPLGEDLEDVVPSLAAMVSEENVEKLRLTSELTVRSMIAQGQYDEDEIIAFSVKELEEIKKLLEEHVSCDVIVD